MLEYSNNLKSIWFSFHFLVINQGIMSYKIVTSLVLTFVVLKVASAELTIPQKIGLTNFFDMYFDPKIRGERRGYLSVEKCLEVHEALHLENAGMSKAVFRKIAGGLLAVTISATVGLTWTKDPPNKVRSDDWILLAEKISQEPKTFSKKLQRIFAELLFCLMLKNESSSSTKGRPLQTRTVTFDLFFAFYKTILVDLDSKVVTSKFKAIPKKKSDLVSFDEWMKAPMTQSFLGMLTLEQGEGESQDVKKKSDKGALMLDWLKNGFKHLIPDKFAKTLNL